MKQNYFVYIVTYRNQLEVAPLKNLFFLAVFFLTWRTLLDTTKKLKGWGKPSLQCKLGGWFWNGEVDTPLGTMQYYFYFNCTVVKNLFQQVFPDDFLTRFHIYMRMCKQIGFREKKLRQIIFHLKAKVTVFKMTNGFWRIVKH